MKNLLLFILFLVGLYSNAQDNEFGKIKINLSLGYVYFSEGQEGISFTNGLDIRLSEYFYFSPDLYAGFGNYKYSPEQYHEPSYSEARVLAFQGKFGISPFPKRFSNLRISVGPSLNSYSIIQNYEYLHYPLFDYSDLTSSSKTHFYEHGHITRELYLGMVTELEVRIFKIKNMQFMPFIDINYYLDPFYVEYFGFGIRTNLKLLKSNR